MKQVKLKFYFCSVLGWQAFANILKSKIPWQATKIQSCFDFWNVKSANPSLVVPRGVYLRCNSTALLPIRNIPPPPRGYDPPSGGIELPREDPIP